MVMLAMQKDGQDVICAAVSALVLNMANSVETFTDDHFEGSVGEDGGSFLFPSPDKISSESQLLSEIPDSRTRKYPG